MRSLPADQYKGTLFAEKPPIFEMLPPPPNNRPCITTNGNFFLIFFVFRRAFSGGWSSTFGAPNLGRIALIYFSPGWTTSLVVAGLGAKAK